MSRRPPRLWLTSEKIQALPKPAPRAGGVWSGSSFVRSRLHGIGHDAYLYWRVTTVDLMSKRAITDRWPAQAQGNVSF